MVVLGSHDSAFLTTGIAEDTLTGDGGEGDAAGKAVAIARTAGTRLVVGAPNDDSGGLDAGAVYVYRETSGGWGSPEKIISPTPAANAFFGSAVAMDASGSRFVVGAYGHGGSERGGAWVYDCVPACDGTAVALVDPGNQEGDQFGFTVAISDDGTVIAVAATKDDNIGTE